MCLYPSIVRNPKYKKNKKNKGRVPWASDPRILYIPIGCGQCIECRKQKTSKWRIRLKEEQKANNTGKFVTLTFNDEQYELLRKQIKETEDENTNLHEIVKLAIRRFTENWRSTHKKTIKHWLVAEIGHKATERLHLHGLLYTNETASIRTKWKYGYVFIGYYVTERTINYITKYITKIDRKNPWFKPHIFTSNGIGKAYLKTPHANLNKFKTIGTRDKYVNTNGVKSGLPIYYRNHLYTEKEREKLWIEKLDEQTRYVLGQKFDVSTEQGEAKYRLALKTAQQKNDNLGYGKREQWDYETYNKSLNELRYKEPHGSESSAPLLTK